MTHKDFPPKLTGPRIVPDAQSLCWHMIGIVARADGGQTIIDRNTAELLDMMDGYHFQYCPMCGAKLEGA